MWQIDEGWIVRRDPKGEKCKEDKDGDETQPDSRERIEARSARHASRS